MSHIGGQNVSHRRTECLTSEDRMSHIEGQNVSHRRTECLTSEDRMSHIGGQKINRARFCPHRTKITEDLCVGGGGGRGGGATTPPSIIDSGEIYRPVPHDRTLGRCFYTFTDTNLENVTLQYVQAYIMYGGISHYVYYLVTCNEHLLFGCVFV